MSGPILIATGGTGGHVFPALAVADALRARGRGVAFLTDARGLRYLAGQNAVFEVPAASPSGGLSRRLSAGATLVRGLLRALALVRRLRPGATAAFGGYASFPAVVACRLGRVPLLVHEQNAVLGRANRLAARFASALALSFEATAGVPETLRGRAVVTGNPVRPGFRAEPRDPAAPDASFRLLVTGGSQGAKRLGEVVPAAMAQLPAALRRRTVLWFQCREEQRQETIAQLAGAGLAGFEVQPFFDDMPARLAAASLVIARAGASTIAELLAVARPAILVPYPHAADDHQTANARRLVEVGAAELMVEQELDAARLARRIGELAAAPERLRAMCDAARRLARPDAAERIADLLLDLVPAEDAR